MSLLEVGLIAWAVLCAGAAVLVLGLCRMSAMHSRREEEELARRIVEEGRG